MVSNLIYSGVKNLAHTVRIEGKVIFRQGRSTVFDEEKVIMDAKEGQARTLSDSGLAKPIGVNAYWPTL